MMQCIIDELPLSFLSELLRHKASLSVQNHKGYTALHMAVRDGLHEAVSALLAHARNQGQGQGQGSRDCTSALDGEFGWTPLMHAAAKGQSDIVRLMAEAGVDVNVQDKVRADERPSRRALCGVRTATVAPSHRMRV